MTMKSLFMFYVVLLLVPFTVIHINHALGLAHVESGAIQDRALIPRPNYTVTPARKLLLLPDIGDGDGTGDGSNGIGGNSGDDGIGGDVGGGVGGNSGGDGIGGYVGGGDGIGGNSGGDGIGGYVGGGDGIGGNSGGDGDNGGNEGIGNNDGGEGSENRIGPASCSKDNIQVNQGPTPPLPSGIPTYTVIVENTCYLGSCIISNIHLSCSSFSSARLINPRVFRRLTENDCLVNDGQPLSPGQSLTFQYANTFKYPLSVSSVAC